MSDKHKLNRLTQHAIMASLAVAGPYDWMPPQDFKSEPTGLKGQSYGRARYRPTTASDERHKNKMVRARRKKNKAAKKARRKNR